MSTDAQSPRPRTFPHLRPFTDEEYVALYAKAVWNDLCDASDGRPMLRKHRVLVNDRPAYRFPFADRVYLVHRDEDADTWAITLYAAPSAEESVQIERLVLTSERTRRDAIFKLVSLLYKTVDDHGYLRASDSCPNCDSLKDDYLHDEEESMN